MKTNYSVAFACIAAATAGLSGATTFAVVDTATTVGKCDTAELVAKLLPLLGDDNFPKCQKDSGFTFFPFAGLSNNAQITKLCKTKACQSLLEQVVKAELPSCELEYQGIAFNVKDTVELLATKCLPPSSQWARRRYQFPPSRLSIKSPLSTGTSRSLYWLVDDMKSVSIR